jgi:hypothetical protein
MTKQLDRERVVRRGFHGRSTDVPKEMSTFIADVLRLIFPDKPSLDFQGWAQGAILRNSNNLFSLQGGLVYGGNRKEREKDQPLFINVDVHVPDCEMQNSGRRVMLHLIEASLTPEDAHRRIHDYLIVHPITRENWKVLQKNGHIPNPVQEFWQQPQLDKLCERLFTALANGKEEKFKPLEPREVWDKCIEPVIGKLSRKNLPLLVHRHIAYLMEEGWLQMASDKPREKGMLPGPTGYHRIYVLLGVFPRDSSPKSPELTQFVEEMEFLSTTQQDEMMNWATKMREAKDLLFRVSQMLEELSPLVDDLERAVATQQRMLEESNLAEEMLKGRIPIFYEAISRISNGNLTATRLIRESKKLVFQRAEAAAETVSIAASLAATTQ